MPFKLNTNIFYEVFYSNLQSSFSIRSHLTYRERVELYSIAQKNNNNVVVEIGSYLCASAAAFGAGMKYKSKGRLFCIDTWMNDSMTEGSKDTMEDFLKNIEPFAELVVPIRGWSTEVVGQIAKQIDSIDLLFIDGDHSYEGCLADWQSYAPLLSDSAIVAFHDVGWAEGVQAVVEQEVRPHVVREKWLKNLWWGCLGK